VIADLVSDSKAMDRLKSECPKVFVVGSGAGGASVAYRLASLGVDVMVLEMGLNLSQGRHGLPDKPA
jgi:choline dehydrogenase-like flavoprotein